MQIGHTAEDAVFVCVKLFRLAFLSDPSVIEDDDLIRCLDGAHTVGDDQHGLAGEQARQSATVRSGNMTTMNHEDMMNISAFS
ncbi:MAG: hypothetical protein IJV64_06710 [Oscillospiraceae bacterium]|nr:hypothetical protein [Oscillospiraceae bacterium]